MPGIASWVIAGTAGTQLATASPCSRRSSRLASSSAGSLNSQRPIASKPAAAYADTSSANVALIVEISESASRIQYLACWKPCKNAASERGLRQRLVDEVAGARAETGAGVRARADVP